MTKPVREFIGRSALFVLGAMFLFGGYRCIHKGLRIEAEYREEIQQKRLKVGRRHSSGGGFIVLVGAGLLLVGAPLAFAAIVPVDVFARFFKPPDLRTGDNNVGIDEDDTRGRFWPWWWRSGG